MDLLRYLSTDDAMMESHPLPIPVLKDPALPASLSYFSCSRGLPSPSLHPHPSNSSPLPPKSTVFDCHTPVLRWNSDHHPSVSTHREKHTLSRLPLQRCNHRKGPCPTNLFTHSCHFLHPPVEVEGSLTHFGRMGIARCPPLGQLAAVQREVWRLHTFPRRPIILLDHPAA